MNNDNKENDKYLEPVKEGFFAKLANFFKSLFSKKSDLKVENAVNTEKIETEENVQTVESASENENEVSEEVVDIKVKVAEIQKRYEENGYDLTLLTDEEFYELKLLYQEQITYLNRRYENKVRELKATRTKIQKLEAKA